MGKVETLEHFDQVLREDRRFIAANYMDILGRSHGLSAVKDGLKDWSRDPLNAQVHSSQPRLSLRFLREAFKSLSLTERKQQAALSLAGEILLPLAGVDNRSEPIPASLIKAAAGGCSRAEIYFDAALDQVMTGTYREQPRISVVYDPEHGPLVFKKTASEGTALTLQALKLGEAVLPPGTIVAVDESLNTEPSGLVIQDLCQYEAFALSGPIGINPVRLSPWAYQGSLDRSLFAVNDHHNQPFYFPERAAIAEGRTIDDFREAAHTVMAICGVE